MKQSASILQQDFNSRTSKDNHWFSLLTVSGSSCISLNSVLTLRWAFTLCTSPSPPHPASHPHLQGKLTWQSAAWKGQMGGTGLLKADGRLAEKEKFKIQTLAIKSRGNLKHWIIIRKSSNCFKCIFEFNAGEVQLTQFLLEPWLGAWPAFSGSFCLPIQHH